MNSHHNRPNRVEADYVPEARRLLTAKRLLEKAKTEVMQAKRACASKMNAVKVREFMFQSEGRTFEARLERPTGRRTSVRKLYTMLSNGELTLDTFLECVVADEDTVMMNVSDDSYKFLNEAYQKSVDLIIEPV